MDCGRAVRGGGNGGAGAATATLVRDELVQLCSVRKNGAHSGGVAEKLRRVRIDSQRAQQFAIKDLPTQIFYDAEGKELFRHEGFFDKADILAKWKELGVLNEVK